MADLPDAGRILVRPLREDDIAPIAKLHVSAFPGFFLSELGERFLREFYRGHLNDPSAIGFVVEDDRGVVRGAVVGTSNPKGFYSRLARRRWPWFMVASMGLLLRRPSVANRLLRGLFYRGDGALASSGALLSSLCVDAGARGRGWGKRLVEEWCSAATLRGVRSAYLLTDTHANEGTLRFYGSLGWSCASEVAREDGRVMSLLTRELGAPPRAAAPTKPRVLQVVAGDAFGGASRMILALASHLKKEYDVTVATTEAQLTALLRSRGIAVTNDYGIARSVSPLSDLCSAIRLARFLRSGNFAVVHSHTSKGGVIARVAGALAGTPYVLHTIHNFAFGPSSSRLAVTLNMAIEWILSRWTTSLTVVSQILARECAAWRLRPLRGVRVVPNGVPEACMSRSIVVRASRRVQPLIVYHGRLAPGKGLEDLLKSASSLREAGAAFDLALFGEGEHKDELRVLARRLGWPDSIFRGFLHDIPRVLESADVCVQPSYREGMSVALLEAMRAGRCIVASDIAPNMEVLGSPATGLTFPVGDGEMLARQLSRAIDSAELRNALGDAARTRYLACFTEEIMLQGYDEIYRDLFGS